MEAGVSTHDQADPGSTPEAHQLSVLERENQTLRSEIEELTANRNELLAVINQDPHTGLPIRRVFDRDFRTVSEDHAHHNDLLAVAVVRLDRRYDRIKNSRDRGKVFLFRTAARMRETIGERVYQSDRIDEFLLLMGATKNERRARSTAEAIVREVSMPHEPPAKDVAFGCSVGICLYKDGDAQREEILGNAYIALDESEATGRPVVVYNEEMGRRYHEKETIEKELRRAIQDGFDEFSIVYQPFVDRDGRIHGCEALIRWNNRILGPIPPGRFIGVAEENGDIRFIGQWTLYNACRQLRDWREAYGTSMYVSVNLSPSQFKQTDLVERISGILGALKLPGDALKLEITEGVVMEDPEDAITKMEEIRSHGVRISIDDFGIGYSSLNYLRRLPINTLKIDKSFIDDLSANTNNREIVKAIISMARGLKIEALAEGVETLEQLEFLLAEECNSIQGYLFSPPVAADEFSAFLKAGGVVACCRDMSAS
ncbi:MAG: GGDEF domain-containing protein [Spirochaetaceae bacterium]|nr:MAG: GGDEF domain-containing protein [Spirochaetaceae bacterium]